MEENNQTPLSLQTLGTLGRAARLAPLGGNERKSDLFGLVRHKSKGHVLGFFLAGFAAGHKVLSGTFGAANADQTHTNIA